MMQPYLVFPAGSTYVVFSSFTHFPAANSYNAKNSINTLSSNVLSGPKRNMMLSVSQIC